MICHFFSFKLSKCKSDSRAWTDHTHTHRNMQASKAQIKIDFFFLWSHFRLENMKIKCLHEISGNEIRYIFHRGLKTKDYVLRPDSIFFSPVSSRINLFSRRLFGLESPPWFMYITRHIRPTKWNLRVLYLQRLEAHLIAHPNVPWTCQTVSTHGGHLQPLHTAAPVHITPSCAAFTVSSPRAQRSPPVSCLKKQLF
jgi:hypothetical protein